MPASSYSCSCSTKLLGTNLEISTIGIVMSSARRRFLFSVSTIFILTAELTNLHMEPGDLASSSSTSSTLAMLYRPSLATYAYFIGPRLLLPSLSEALLALSEMLLSMASSPGPTFWNTPNSIRAMICFLRTRPWKWPSLSTTGNPWWLVLRRISTRRTARSCSRTVTGGEVMICRTVTTSKESSVAWQRYGYPFSFINTS
mmetsp:Transcript_25161/g.69393  ORF Transcript_25161/g.69393 Transcript_25161/m.69393 type:complete len:201 (+) Transcript_25161:663-1265(+)